MNEISRGNLLFKGNRKLVAEKLKYLLIGIVYFFPILVTLVVISTGPLMLAIFILILISPYAYVALIPIFAGLNGVNQLEIFEKGFVIPNHTVFLRNLIANNYISYDDIESIYLNPYQNSGAHLRMYTVITHKKPSSFNMYISSQIRSFQLNRFLAENVTLVNLDYFFNFSYRWSTIGYPGSAHIEISNDGIEIIYEGGKTFFHFNDIIKIFKNNRWLLKVQGIDEGISFINMEKRRKDILYSKIKDAQSFTS